MSSSSSPELMSNTTSASMKDKITEAFSDPKVVCAFVVVICVLGWIVYTYLIKPRMNRSTPQSPPPSVETTDEPSEDGDGRQQPPEESAGEVVENVEEF